MKFATHADHTGFGSAVLQLCSAIDGRMLAALVTSLLLHGLTLSWFPGLRGSMIEVPQRLQVWLPPVARAEPVAVFPAQAPTARANRRAAAPALAPNHRGSLRESVPLRQETLVMPTGPAAQLPQEMPLAANPDRAGADQAVRPIPAPAVAAADHVDADVLRAYGRQLAGAVAAHRRYPRIALLRQWEGTAVIQLELTADGRLSAVRILNSSGYETLDRQAVEMVREAVPFPPPPDALAGRSLTLAVPVVFRIAS